MRFACLALLASGCSAIFGLDPPVLLDGANGDGIAPTDGTTDTQGPMIDARVCPPAPPNCTPFTCGSATSSCYYVCSVTKTYQDAVDECVAQSACLVTIDSQAELSCVTNATTPGFPDIVWMGWQQSAAGAEPAGGWSWKCGSSTFLASNWGMFEPNNDGGAEDCGAMTSGGAWIDTTCSFSARYVCEL